MGFYKPERTILRGVVGSQAYGLATPQSDEDIYGIYLAETDDILGLSGAQAADHSEVKHEPDVAHHELGKYLHLALKCNPTVLEFLWLDSYLIKHPSIGLGLIELRYDFLSAPAIRKVYGGFCTAQAKRIHRGEGRDRDDAQRKIEKLGRHWARLLTQGMGLLTTGDLQVNVSDKRDSLFEWGERAFKDPEKFSRDAEKAIVILDQTPSVLPDQPNRDAVNDFLVRTRKRATFAAVTEPRKGDPA